MAYNIPNWGFINAGATITVGYWFNNGTSDQGAQYAQGHPQDNGGDLVVTNHEKFFDLEGRWSYFFQMSNVDSDTWYALEGGGLS
jgi:hypothetical protein